MKIVHITPYSMGRPGGVQSNIRDLSAWLCAQGHEVRIVAPPGNTDIPGLMTLGGCRPLTVHGTQFELTRARRPEVKACVEELRDWGAEVVHLHTPWTPMMVWQMWRALQLPSVATFHATLPENSGFDPVAMLLRRSATYFNKRLTSVVVPSQGVRDQWAAQRASPLPRILPPAVDLSLWRKAGLTSQSSDVLKVVYMGRLEQRKGVSVLLDAWAKAHKAIPEAQLIIAGDGSEEGALRDQAAKSGTGGITFRSSPDNEEARTLVASADLFIAPALHGESFGLVLAEAMAAGTVPVAAANSGYATVLSGAGQDLLVPPGQPEALADKIIELAEHPAKLDRMRTWALSQAQRFDIRTVGPAYEAIYHSALT
ncbi:glycosyltransferase family 4 protein [Shimia sp.]|uniref:glycosyltransferase family 4 protein n=1 Tax=Shimia sp. TaxID=1954381 RepID=UPI00329861AA